MFGPLNMVHGFSIEDAVTDVYKNVTRCFVNIRTHYGVAGFAPEWALLYLVLVINALITPYCVASKSLSPCEAGSA